MKEGFYKIKFHSDESWQIVKYVGYEFQVMGDEYDHYDSNSKFKMIEPLLVDESLPTVTDLDSLNPNDKHFVEKIFWVKYKGEWEIAAVTFMPNELTSIYLCGYGCEFMQNEFTEIQIQEIIL